MNKIDKVQIKVIVPRYLSKAVETIQKNKVISSFVSSGFSNADEKVISDFGEEWSKFSDFTDSEINKIGKEYFDILPTSLFNKTTLVLDMGCGSGRWSKYLSSLVGFIDAVDPSKAIFIADQLLKDCPNIRLTRAASDGLPFPDNTYDLVMSIGVLHHIPDTLRAMKDCVSKVKSGGYFYTYLYYNLDNKGKISKVLFKVVNTLRLLVSRLPGKPKKLLTDLFAVLVYMPPILTSRFLHIFNFHKLANKIPLSYYYDKSFFVIRNDALDRFGTTLEQRFSRKQIDEMMRSCGLSEITFSEYAPYWHVIGKKLL